MKRTITKLAVALGLIGTVNVNAQTLTFEEFTLADSSYYKNLNGTDWSSGPATFRYDYNTSWDYWSDGSSYTNMTDSADGSYTNLYGCIAHKGINLSNNYVTMQNGSIVTFSNNTTMVDGFFITNTTYAWKAIKNGDSFARKFGDTTGTGSGLSIVQGEYPDWFKVIVRGYNSGILLTDSVEFYLADYRAAGTANDYAVKNWQYVNCTSLGQVDSLKFELKSSDSGQWGINTPAFFAIDNMVLSTTVGVDELETVSNISVYPNPAKEMIILNYIATTETELSVRIFDISGKEVANTVNHTVIGANKINFSIEALESGMYFIELSNTTSTKKIKFIKL